MRPAIPKKQKAEYASRVAVYWPNGREIYHVHAEEARRLVQDGIATKRQPGKGIRAIELVVTGELERNLIRFFGKDESRPIGASKYTYKERLCEGQPCRCARSGQLDKFCPFCKGRGVELVSTGSLIQHKNILVEDWPTFRSAVIECLPKDKQSEIRQLFEPKRGDSSHVGRHAKRPRKRKKA